MMDLQERLERACKQGPLLIATDFDGTLTPIVSSPRSAVLADETAELLQSLTATPGCTLMVVSGRSLADLRRRVPVADVLAGNHGLEMEGSGLSFRHKDAVGLAGQLAEVCVTLAELLSPWPEALVEQKGLTATVHFRRVPEKNQHSLVVAVRRSLAGFGCTFGLRSGKKAVEIHPRVGWNKGSAVNWVRQRLDLTDASVLCIGDDRTDESMFRECGDAISVAVGTPRFTAAKFSVADPESVIGLLQRVPDWMAVPCTIRQCGAAAPSGGSRLPL